MPTSDYFNNAEGKTYRLTQEQLAGLLAELAAAHEGIRQDPHKVSVEFCIDRGMSGNDPREHSQPRLSHVDITVK